MTRVEIEFENILKGAAWCTNNYIINFMDELSDPEKFELMKKLAQASILFDEESLSDDDLVFSETPKRGRMTVASVVRQYNHLSWVMLTSAFDILDALRGSISGEYEKDVKKLRKAGKTCSRSLYEEASQINDQP